ncbi:MAG: response regulator [Leptospirales bacterium]|nr:response regulator [Leptospirales bacterium]
MSVEKNVILAVDDNRAICEAIREIFAGASWRVEAVYDTAQARSFLQRRSAEVALLVLDWEMPGESGFEFLKYAKAQKELRLLPVIMLTGRTSPADVESGIAAGALYYVTKPFDPRVLRVLMETALADFQLVREGKARPEFPFDHCTEAGFEFRTLEEAAEVAVFLAALTPDPDSARLGLHELLVNAVEHGNLSISHVEKKELLRTGGLRAEIRRRLADPQYASRLASVRLRRIDGHASFTVRDQGAGFDFQEFLTFSADRAYEQHGRGIAIARDLCFDVLEYRAPGNELTAIMKRKTAPLAEN